MKDLEHSHTIYLSFFFYFYPSSPKSSPEMTAWYDEISIEFKNQTIKELFAKLDGNGIEAEECRISHSELRRVYSQANVCVKLIEYIHKTHTWKELSEISGIHDRTL